MLAREKLRRAVAVARLSSAAEGDLRQDLGGPLAPRISSRDVDAARCCRELLARSGAGRSVDPWAEGGGTAGARAPFVCAYVNLAARTDRAAAMDAQLDRAGLSAGVRFEAATGDDAPERLVTRSWDPALNSRFDRSQRAGGGRIPLSPGERGCAMSHATLWSACADRADDDAPLLILEDDVELAPDFGAKTAALVGAIEEAVAPARRELILYAGADVAAWHAATTYRVHACPPLHMREARYLWQTSSYVLWPAGARALLAHLPVDAPADNFIARLVHARSIRALVALPQLAVQSAARTGAHRHGDIEHTRADDSRPGESSADRS